MFCYGFEKNIYYTYYQEEKDRPKQAAKKKKNWDLPKNLKKNRKKK